MLVPGLRNAQALHLERKANVLGAQSRLSFGLDHFALPFASDKAHRLVCLDDLFLLLRFLLHCFAPLLEKPVSFRLKDCVEIARVPKL